MSKYRLRFSGRNVSRLAVWCERLLLAAGVALLAFVGLAVLDAEFYRWYDQWAFEQIRTGRPASVEAFIKEKSGLHKNEAGPGNGAEPAGVTIAKPENDLATGVPDQRDWSAQRRRAFQRASQQSTNAPMAKLEIPALKLTAMVLEGTSARILNHGVGHIEGTALPGQRGNVGLAGHRDGYFRSLGRISKNDLIVLTTKDAIFHYHVRGIEIADPSDISTLKNHRISTLTLVTCYPIYYIGPAPKRLVVTAWLDGDGPS